MDDWEKLYETSSTEKEDFYNNINVEDITHADYRHAKGVLKEFEIESKAEYHDLYVTK